MRKCKMTWNKRGVADITAICYNCTDMNSRTMYNRNYKFHSLLNILP